MLAPTMNNHLLNRHDPIPDVLLGKVNLGITAYHHYSPFGGWMSAEGLLILNQNHKPDFEQFVNNQI